MCLRVCVGVYVRAGGAILMLLIITTMMMITVAKPISIITICGHNLSFLEKFHPQSSGYFSLRALLNFMLFNSLQFLHQQ